MLVTSSRLGRQVAGPVPQCFCSSHLILLTMVPKLESSDAGNSDTPKRGRRVLPLREESKFVA